MATRVALVPAVEVSLAVAGEPLGAEVPDPVVASLVVACVPVEAECHLGEECDEAG